MHLALLRRLLERSRDARAPTVRVAVCEAFAFVLEQRLAQPLLAQALPQLAPLLHDRVASVRMAFTRLMVAVKGVKAIKFYETAPPDSLLQRLAVNDSTKMQSAICTLLQPTFFPHQKSVVWFFS